MHRLAIHPDNSVVCLKAGSLGRRSRCHLTDLRSRRLITEEIKRTGKQEKSQNEISDRTCEDNEGALPDWLAVELIGLRRALRIRLACRVDVAGEFHITAYRQPTDFPSRSMAIGSAPDLASEPDGKNVHLDPAQTRDFEMPVFVNEDNDG